MKPSGLPHEPAARRRHPTGPTGATPPLPKAAVRVRAARTGDAAGLAAIEQMLWLETRLDNHCAQSLFARLGVVEFARTADDDADGATAIRCQKYLRDLGHAANAAALHRPHYAQTLDFTCGPSALMMAMAAPDPRIESPTTLPLAAVRARSSTCAGIATA